jgi:hypothetical protein
MYDPVTLERFPVALIFAAKSSTQRPTDAYNLVPFSSRLSWWPPFKTASH